MSRPLLALAALVLGLAACSNTPSVAPSSPSSSGDPFGTGEPTTIASQAPGAVTFTDGEHRVGDDIQPGTYRAIAPATGDGFCFWERVSGFGGSEAETIANSAGVGPRVVTISATDAGFVSDDCGTWSSDLASLRGPIGDGIWIVGTDVAPGRYSSAGGASCVWQRLSGFGGTSEESLEAGVEGAVEIKATDRGFSSSNCGTWAGEAG
jgi:hypothetical protein